MGRWSVNTWIIVVNIAVFVIVSFAQQSGKPVPVGTAWIKDPGGRSIVQSPYILGKVGSTVLAQEPHLKRAGVPVHTQLLDASTGELLGHEFYHVMDPLTRLGHFSTAEGFFFRRLNTTFLNIQVWRLITFQFLHAGIWHLVMNLFGLWVFGSLVEQNLGRKKYLAFYLMCGICGGLMYLVLNGLGQTGLPLPAFLPNDPRTPLVGASAGVYGVILACAYLMPNERVFLMFLPIPLRLKWVAYAYVAFFGLQPAEGW